MTMETVYKFRMITGRKTLTRYHSNTNLGNSAIMFLIVSGQELLRGVEFWRHQFVVVRRSLR